DIRIAQIREKRTSDELWRAKVYGKKDDDSSMNRYENYEAPKYEPMKVASPSRGPYYLMEPTGTPEDDERLMEAIAYRKSGGKYYTLDEWKARMKTVIGDINNAKRV
ncbi:MAG: hypothetical protein FWE57_05720, partial [Chitinispirillia bacterium]|nr:hypothetical protein [Chitinispirillia bacterium]